MSANSMRNARRRAHASRRVWFGLSVTATRELDRLASERHCSHSDVVEGLLLGTIARAPVDPEIATAMMVHGFSLGEAEQFVECRR